MIASPPPRIAVTSTATGLFLMSFFTLLWASNTFAGWPVAAATAVLALAVIAVTCFVAQGVRLLRARRRFPAELSADDARYRKRSGRAFGLIFGAEGLLIWLSVVALNATDRTDYVVPVIALIVGLHFYPMGRIFRRRIDLYLATWTCLVALAGVAAIAAGIAVEHVTPAVGLGAAAATTAYGVYMFRGGAGLLRRAGEAATPAG
ncbi:hypothetical protein GCM10010172_84730 [Paractinoplanes ferrugineus]|uniref:Uncharacterized protein n=1 Tax=Paractinoplanes ferrugineus TaxID=113564 RepID=A0A919MPE2_9ACTN|nr:hypothetical protein [Actinoplanes ferrugineus]GIE15212.1 hypothetical protein Afe05nite_70520 [Actinoplanes ferrugineus]